jgi:hypothetical protein
MSLPGEQWPILLKLAEYYQAAGKDLKAQKARAQAAEIIQALAARMGDEALRRAFLMATNNENKGS